jgi:hypothetical protein
LRLLIVPGEYLLERDAELMCSRRPALGSG